MLNIPLSFHPSVETSCDYCLLHTYMCKNKFSPDSMGRLPKWAAK